MSESCDKLFTKSDIEHTKGPTTKRRLKIPLCPYGYVVLVLSEVRSDLTGAYRFAEQPREAEMSFLGKGTGCSNVFVMV